MTENQKPAPPPFRNPPPDIPIDIGEKIFLIILAAYVVAMIVTFGHVAANARCDYGVREGRQTHCKLVKGVVVAPFWPLYWSWEFFDRQKGGDA